MKLSARQAASLEIGRCSSLIKTTKLVTILDEYDKCSECLIRSISQWVNVQVNKILNMQWSVM